MHTPCITTLLLSSGPVRKSTVARPFFPWATNHASLVRMGFSQ
jgi:hypothetical protein